MCGGDRHSIDVTVEAGARAVIIMQSASRLLAMDEGDHARLDVTLTVRSGGQLEYYPGLTIPFADSSFVQRITATVESGGRLGLLETWATGRSSRGESLQFRRISAHGPGGCRRRARLCGRDGTRARDRMTCEAPVSSRGIATSPPDSGTGRRSETTIRLARRTARSSPWDSPDRSRCTYARSRWMDSPWAQPFRAPSTGSTGPGVSLPVPLRRFTS